LAQPSTVPPETRSTRRPAPPSDSLRRLDALATFAGGTAHEFNNLLATVLSSAELIARDVTPEGEVGEAIQAIRGACDRAIQLTSRMLALAGTRPGRLAFVDPVDVIKRACERIPPFRRPGAHVVTDLPKNPPSIVGNAAELVDALAAVIQNAIESIDIAGRAHGVVGVRVGRIRLDRALRERAVFAFDLADGEYAVVTVEDDGTGIERDVLPRIFEPFFSTRFEGRGLGLSSAAGIARAHGGSICVETRAGYGTIVRILLPIEAAPVRNDASSAKIARPRTSVGTILLADDDALLRRATTRMLRRDGFDVELACNGAEAIERFSRRPSEIDLVMLDVVMPEVGGEEAMAAIRRIRPHVPILLLSGYTPARVDAEALLQPSTAYLAKPFRHAHLLQTIEDLLGPMRRSDPSFASG
jgi:nitrogen-specific signal transduction histidine kinase/CheY-like chemotaxis protein